MTRRLLWAAPCAFLWAAVANATTTATVNTTVTVFPAIVFSPSPLAFGNQQIGHPASQILTVTNHGAGALAFSVGLGASSDPAFGIANDCGASLAANASCQITVSFSPTVAAAASASVVISGAGRTYSDTVSGTGTVTAAPTPAAIALSPASIQIQDNATGGSIVSTATVTMSDGSTNNACVLSTSDTAFTQISGQNVVLRHGLSAADDGQHNTTISVVSCP